MIHTPAMNETAEVPIEIPLQSLGEDVLIGVVQEFILREGTDYGAAEVSLEKKVQQVLAQIRSGEVGIFFDATSESVTLVANKRMGSKI